MDIQRLINYAMYLEASAGSVAKPEEINALADEISRNWWKKIRAGSVYEHHY
ncbi:MAG: hypothetical protein LBG31_01325 [Prevotellaceae bacterium]|nr:hypothetical protein [Prevotellaceae bacterium]